MEVKELIESLKRYGQESEVYMAEPIIIHNRAIPETHILSIDNEVCISDGEPQ